MIHIFFCFNFGDSVTFQYPTNMSHPIAMVLQNSKQEGANIETILKSLEWPSHLQVSQKPACTPKNCWCCSEDHYTLHDHIQNQKEDVQLQHENINIFGQNNAAIQTNILFMNPAGADCRITCFWLTWRWAWFVSRIPPQPYNWCGTFSRASAQQKDVLEIFVEYLEFSEMYSCFREFLTLEKDSVALSTADVPELAYCHRKYNNRPMEHSGTFIFHGRTYRRKQSNKSRDVG